MKTLVLFLYHTAAAIVLNWRASRHANALRTGTPGSGQKLKDIGARSNKHEDAANTHWQVIREKPVIHAMLAALVIALLIKIAI